MLIFNAYNSVSHPPLISQRIGSLLQQLLISQLNTKPSSKQTMAAPEAAEMYKALLAKLKAAEEKNRELEEANMALRKNAVAQRGRRRTHGDTADEIMASSIKTWKQRTNLREQVNIIHSNEGFIRKWSSKLVEDMKVYSGEEKNVKKRQGNPLPACVHTPKMTQDFVKYITPLFTAATDDSYEALSELTETPQGNDEDGRAQMLLLNTLTGGDESRRKLSRFFTQTSKIMKTVFQLLRARVAFVTASNRVAVSAGCEIPERPSVLMSDAVLPTINERVKKLVAKLDETEESDKKNLKKKSKKRKRKQVHKEEEEDEEDHGDEVEAEDDGDGGEEEGDESDEGNHESGGEDSESEEATASAPKRRRRK